jgi:hypothetical protein
MADPFAKFTQIPSTDDPFAKFQAVSQQPVDSTDPKVRQASIMNDDSIPSALKTFLAPEASDSMAGDVLTSIEAGADNLRDAYTAGLTQRAQPYLELLKEKMTGGDRSLDELKAQAEEEDQALDERSPIASGAGYLTGLLAPGGVLSGALKVGQKTAQTAKSIPYLEKMLRGPFMQGLIRGGTANTIFGQVDTDFDSSLSERGEKAAKDFSVGGLLDGTVSKIGSGLVNTISIAKSPKEVDKILTELDDAYSFITDQTQRAQAIKQHLEQVSLNEMGSLGDQAKSVLNFIKNNDDAVLSKVSQLRGQLGQLFPKAEAPDVGRAVGKAVVDELDDVSENINQFYAKYTKGNTTPTETKSAIDYLTGFFKKHGLMNEKGSWLDESGNVSDKFVPRYGFGKTTEAQQRFLADRLKDLWRSPGLNEVSNIRQTIQGEAYGAQPLFAKDSKGIVKGLANTLKSDEEQAIKQLYGDEVYNEFLKSKGDFSKAYSSIKSVGKKIGLGRSPETGELMLVKDPDKVISGITKLSAEELNQLKPIFEKRNAWEPLRSHLMQNLLGETPEEAAKNIGKFGLDNLNKFFSKSEVAQIQNYISQKLPDASRALAFEQAPGKISKTANKALESGVFNPKETKLLQGLISKADDVSGKESALSTVQKGYQNIAKNLADNPQFIADFEKAKGLLPKEALTEIKGDYLSRVVNKASKDGKVDYKVLAHELKKLTDTAKSMLFESAEIAQINKLIEQSSLATERSFLSRVLSKTPIGQKILPNQMVDPLIEATPERILNLLKKLGEFTQTGGQDYIAPALSGGVK